MIIATLHRDPRIQDDAGQGSGLEAVIPNWKLQGSRCQRCG